MKVIRRYSITADDHNGMYPRPSGQTAEGITFYYVGIPRGADVLSAGEVCGVLCVRAAVDQGAPRAERKIAIIQDGDSVPKGVFVGTVEVNPTTEPFASHRGTWHVFDLGEA